ncbi:F0F1 ATP synthase subunit gamma [Acidicapsa dinghuensis]|uniref:ATP synthase gamma chain n=1 Tax=Acidicapsa dinghuensis TaxID=2218256 RepID=A0ABW1EF11_9BACT|nr:FoF1 ATP synthase subunit gamma [Acidicapsa dinghuensis]
MPSVLDLKRRIRSVKNTRQITKAMKMVSAARLRRAQARALAARPYAQMITSVLESLVRRIEIIDPETNNIRHPLFLSRPEKRVLLVVIAGDRGFAGAFNGNILKAAFNYIHDRGEKEIDIETVGRKSTDAFRRRYPAAIYNEKKVDNPADGEMTVKERDRKAPIEMVGDHLGILEKLEAHSAFEIAEEIIRRYVHEEIDACYIVYNEFKSVIQQRVVTERLLPLIEIGKHDITQSIELTREEREEAARAAASAGIELQEPDTHEADEEAKKFGTAEVDYIYDESPEELFNGLLPQYVSAMLYHAMAESVAAEHAARMTAMDAATNNASDMIDAYTLKMNRVRQAAITKEIIEIVSGAAAV